MIEEYVKMQGLSFEQKRQIILNMRNRLGWLGRGTTS